MTYEKKAIEVTFKMSDGTTKTLTDTKENDFEATRQLAQYENFGDVTIDGEVYDPYAIVSSKVEQLDPIEMEKADDAFCNYECSGDGDDGNYGLISCDFSLFIGDEGVDVQLSPEQYEKDAEDIPYIHVDLTRFCGYKNEASVSWKLNEGYHAELKQGDQTYTENPLDFTLDLASLNGAALYIYKDGNTKIHEWIAFEGNCGH